MCFLAAINVWVILFCVNITNYKYKTKFHELVHFSSVIVWSLYSFTGIAETYKLYHVTNWKLTTTVLFHGFLKVSVLSQLSLLLLSASYHVILYKHFYQTSRTVPIALTVNKKLEEADKAVTTFSPSLHQT